MNSRQIREIARNRILVVDGAMGTLIQGHGLTESDFRGRLFASHTCDVQGNNDLLSLTRPDVIAGIHRTYLEAGADIIKTNTFNASAISQADYQTEGHVYDMNLASARLACEAADEFTAESPDQPRFVAGDLGPTNRSASLSPDVEKPGYRNVSFDDLRVAYYEQARGLLDGGIDIFLVETVFDTLNSKAALFAIKTLQEERQTDLPVWVSGTITDSSGRTGPFVPVNAAAIPSSMIESELFGHTKGAFTGAGADRIGLFEQADDGTFYLNEIADSSPEFQAKLLQVLETRTVRRLGDNEERPVSFRLIAATNHDLQKAISEQNFRLDLFHRLNEIPIHLPPLAERREDIPALVHHFLTECGLDLANNGNGQDYERLAGLLTSLPWPGNVRELKAMISRLWIESHGDMSRSGQACQTGAFS